MKKFFEIGHYQQFIEFDGNKITKSSCTCSDFVFRKLKKVGEGSIKKVRQTGICKHLRLIYINLGFDEHGIYKLGKK